MSGSRTSEVEAGTTEVDARIAEAQGGPIPPRALGPAVRMFASHASPRILGVAAGTALVARVVVGGWTIGDAWVALAIVAAWPMQEWLIHVLLLHWKPREILGRRIDPANARKHRAHHREPTDIGLVFAPLHSHARVIPLLVFGSVVVLPTAGLAATAVGSYLLLALHYEWSHFLAHVPYTPGPYRRICQNHMLHHYKSEKHWYGVSMLSGDLIMGTRPDPQSTPKSPTVRTLGVEA